MIHPGPHWPHPPVRPGIVAAMLTLHVAFHLHGVGVADAVRGTVPEATATLRRPG